MFLLFFSKIESLFDGVVAMDDYLAQYIACQLYIIYIFMAFIALFKRAKVVIFFLFLILFIGRHEKS